MSEGSRGLPRPANVLQRKGGKVPLGLQIFSGNPAIVEIVGVAGFDFVMLDTEHACSTCSDIQHLIRAADSAGLTSLVRISDRSSTTVRQSLELGAHGLVIPQIYGAADVDEVSDAAFFPPVGRRGMCPSVRAASYSMDGWTRYYQAQERELSLVPIIETPEAVDSIDEICAHPRVSAVCFGPGDLGLALGYGAEGLGVPEVAEAFRRVVASARRFDVDVMGVPYPDTSAQACADMLQAGVTILLHSIDQFLFLNLMTRLVDELQPYLVGTRGASVPARARTSRVPPAQRAAGPTCSCHGSAGAEETEFRRWRRLS